MRLRVREPHPGMRQAGVAMVLTLSEATPDTVRFASHLVSEEELHRFGPDIVLHVVGKLEKAMGVES